MRPFFQKLAQNWATPIFLTSFRAFDNLSWLSAPKLLTRDQNSRKFLLGQTFTHFPLKKSAKFPHKLDFFHFTIIDKNFDSNKKNRTDGAEFLGCFLKKFAPMAVGNCAQSGHFASAHSTCQSTYQQVCNVTNHGVPKRSPLRPNFPPRSEVLKIKPWLLNIILPKKSPKDFVSRCSYLVTVH